MKIIRQMLLTNEVEMFFFPYSFKHSIFKEQKNEIFPLLPPSLFLVTQTLMQLIMNILINVLLGHLVLTEYSFIINKKKRSKNNEKQTQLIFINDINFRNKWKSFDTVFKYSPRKSKNKTVIMMLFYLLWILLMTILIIQYLIFFLELFLNAFIKKFIKTQLPPIEGKVVLKYILGGSVNILNK